MVVIGSGNEVHLISSKTGVMVSSFKGHSAFVTAFVASEANKDEIVSADVTGTILIWDIATGKVTEEITLPEGPITSLHALRNSRTKQYQELLLLLPDTRKSQNKQINGNEAVVVKTSPGCKLVVYDVASRKTRKVLVGRLPVSDGSYKAKGSDVDVHITVARGFIGGNNGHDDSDSSNTEEYVFAAYKQSLRAWSSEHRTDVSALCDHAATMTCVAANGSADIVATGHVGGKITLWHNINNFLKSTGTIKPICSQLHWHSMFVGSLAFSGYGDVLYSGGEEGVLVVWEVASGGKSFVPRLGAPINALTAAQDSPSVAVSSSDNCIRIYNAATRKAEWTLRAACLSHHPVFLGATSKPSDKSGCSVIVDPHTRHVVTTGYPGQVQAMDVPLKDYVYSHDVVSFSRVSRPEGDITVFVPSVTLLAYSTYMGAGLNALPRFLATVDAQKGEEMSVRYSLKIWSWYQNRWHLEAQVDQPHQAHRVMSIAWSPVAPVLVTSGADGSVRVWRRSEVGSGSEGTFRNGIGWRCMYSFKYRSTEAFGLAFSADGSLLSVAYKNVVSLWDFNTVTLRECVIAPNSSSVRFCSILEPKRDHKLGGGAGSAFLLLGSSTSLSIYNIVTSSYVWTLSNEFTCWACAPNESYIDIKGGWIACGVVRKISDKSAVFVEAVETEFAVVILDLFTGKELGYYPTPTKVTSLVFWAATGEDALRGVVVVTQSEELLLVSAPSQSSTKLSETVSNSSGAKVVHALIPPGALDIPLDTYHSIPTQVTGVDRAPQRSWLNTFIGSNSQSLPTVGDVFDAYVGRSLKRLRDPATTTAANANANSVTNQNTGLAKEKSVGFDLSSTSTTEDDTDMFSDESKAKNSSHDFGFFNSVNSFFNEIFNGTSTVSHVSSGSGEETTAAASSSKKLKQTHTPIASSKDEKKETHVSSINTGNGEETTAAASSSKKLKQTHTPIASSKDEKKEKKTEQEVDVGVESVRNLFKLQPSRASGRGAFSESANKKR